MKTVRTAEKPATSKEILEILGSSDEETITEIQNAGATVWEIEQAKVWLEDEDDSPEIVRKRADGCARHVYEILLEGRDRFESVEAG